jgi:hypothetical protein
MSAPQGATVRERVEGTRRIIETNGWEFTICADDFGDDEPRIADTDLAPRLGLELKHLRDLSARHESAGHITPKVCRTVRGTPESHKNLGGRPGKARFYTEADALFLVTRSEASEAIALTKAMIAVVIAVRRHLSQTVPVEAHTRSMPKPRPQVVQATPVPPAPRTVTVPISPTMEFYMRRWATVQGFSLDSPMALDGVAAVWLETMNSLSMVLVPPTR